MSANAECVHRSMLPTRLRRRYMLITHASEAQLGVEDAPPPVANSVAQPASFGRKLIFQQLRFESGIESIGKSQ